MAPNPLITPDNHMQTQERQALNIESTLDRMKGDRDFLMTLFQVFLDDLPTKLSTMETALGGRDIATLQRTAHSLKGACATIGAERLQEAAHALERRCTDNDGADGIASVLSDVKKEAALTSSVIQRELAV